MPSKTKNAKKRYQEMIKKKLSPAKRKLGAGGRFKLVSEEAAKYYRKRGESPESARKIGEAIAAKIMWQKYGKKKGAQLIKAGKK